MEALRVEVGDGAQHLDLRPSLVDTAAVECPVGDVGLVKPIACCRFEMALTLAADPLDATAVATRPGTPHDPPSAHAREPGGFEIALAIRPPIGK